MRLAEKLDWKGLSLAERQNGAGKVDFFQC
jgi:hypothetical protein